MARQIVNIGASANDGTGDGIRTGGGKINDNFEELYSLLGWGNYADAATTPATQVFNTTASKLQIDGGGGGTEENYLPREIRGISSLWDTTNDKITPIEIGDAYTLRISLTITAKSGSPNDLICQLDIGGGATPTIVITEVAADISRTPPFNVTFSFPIFCLSTFLSNGGQLFFKTNAGSVTISNRSLYIKRDFKGSI